MNPLVSMREALDDPELFGTLLTGDSWLPWRVLLMAMLGEDLSYDERQIFAQLTQRGHEPLRTVEEFWGVVGRRGGKTRAMSVLAAYLASLCDWSDSLVRGERGRLIYTAYNQKQSSIAFDYTKAIFTDFELFRNMVQRTPSADSISLNNDIDLEIRTASWRGLRGITCVAAIFDELAFFQTEDSSANVDREILAAVRPALATTRGPLIAISSPHGKSGEVWNAVARDFGSKGDPGILVARGSSRTFNPTLPQAVVDRALERDAASARAEYLAEFRDDIANFVDLETINKCVYQPVEFFPPCKQHLPYFAFVDPSGGRSDSMVLAIGHDEPERNRVVLAKVVEVMPPFEPEKVVRHFVGILENYGLKAVTGDAYAGAWVSDAFQKHDVVYHRSRMSKTEIYLNFLPLLNSKQVLMPNVPKLANQLAGLQRKVTANGRESVDHAASGRDDVANAAAGVLTLIARRRYSGTITKTTFVPM